MRLEIYRFLHLVGLITLVSSLTTIYMTDKRIKVANIVLGVSGLVMLIAGFGMISVMGYSMHSVWIAGKTLIWAIIAIGAPIIAKRKPELKTPVFIGMLALLAVAVGLAILKP